MRGFLLSFFDIFLFGFLQIGYEASYSSYSLGCNICAVCFMIFGITIMIHSPLYIYSQTSESKQEGHQSLYLEEFSYNKPFQGYFYFLFMFTRFVTSVILVFFQNIPLAQIIVAGTCPILVFAYIIIFLPFTEDYHNYFVLSTEFCNFIMILTIGVYFFDPNDTIQVALRWVCFTFFWLGVVLCIIRFFTTLFKKSTFVGYRVDAVEIIEKKENDESNKIFENVKNSENSKNFEKKDSEILKINLDVKDVNTEKKIYNDKTDAELNNNDEPQIYQRSIDLNGSDNGLIADDQPPRPTGISYFSSLAYRIAERLKQNKNIN